MCEECKSGRLDATGELLATSPLSSESDAVLFFEPLQLGIDNLAEDLNIKLDNKEFARGIKDASYACGMYTALINVGFSMEDAVAYIFNRMNVDHNILTTQISTNANIEVSKNASILKEKELL
jgi:hypothetical protein